MADQTNAIEACRLALHGAVGPEAIKAALDAVSKVVWDELDGLIISSPIDGISAQGTESETVAIEQRKFVDGIRAARLRVLATLKGDRP